MVAFILMWGIIGCFFVYVLKKGIQQQFELRDKLGEEGYKEYQNQYREECRIRKQENDKFQREYYAVKKAKKAEKKGKRKDAVWKAIIAYELLKK